MAKHKTDDSSAAIGNWMRNRNTIGFVVKAGRYGGTYAHKQQGIEQEKRLQLLNKTAIQQMRLLEDDKSLQTLSDKNEVQRG